VEYDIAVSVTSIFIMSLIHDVKSDNFFSASEARCSTQSRSSDNFLSAACNYVNDAAVGIKHSLRDLTWDVNYCAWAAKLPCQGRGTSSPGASTLPAEHVWAPSGLFGRQSYFVELFTGSSPWSNTEFCQFLRKVLETRNYLRVIKHIKRSRDASWFCAI